ncbi:hypothetical protein [Paraburkholderia sp. DGU8]|uniref:hypothetical protein n=1 Tax=Paraburkholderia sp. DGU8 TaxID=3161997 RepID=UPI0034675E1E
MTESHQLIAPAAGPTLADLKDRIAGAQDMVKTKYRVVSESTDDYVHEAPWKAVAMALMAGSSSECLLAANADFSSTGEEIWTRSRMESFSG